MLSSVRLFAFLTILLPVTTMAGATLPGSLVDADWLAENIDNVVVLDVRKEVDEFLKVGHIKGAILVNAGKVRVNKVVRDVELTRMLPDRKEFRGVYVGAWGQYR